MSDPLDRLGETLKERFVELGKQAAVSQSSPESLGEERAERTGPTVASEWFERQMPIAPSYSPPGAHFLRNSSLDFSSVY